jgi:hypothetical protein
LRAFEGDVVPDAVAEMFGAALVSANVSVTAVTGVSRDRR